MRFLKYIIFVCVFISFFSCRSTKEIVYRTNDLPSISRMTLYKNIKDSTLNYNALKLKKVNISITNSGKTSSYRGSIRIIKDSSIWISVNAALGIEVVRFLLTNDSVQYIDRYHKEFFKGGYEYFSDKLGVEVNYKLIQAFLTSEFVNYERELKNIKNPLYKLLNTEVREGFYMFTSFPDRQYSRKMKKVERKLSKHKEITQYYQFSYVNASSFKIDNIFIEDMSAKWQMRINYSDYSRFSGKLFHKKVYFNLNTLNNKIKCSVKYSGIQFRNKLSLPFRIPSNYKLIN